jgi:hypothetical protein
MVQGKLIPNLSTQRMPDIRELPYPQLLAEGVDIFDKLGKLVATRSIGLSMATLVECEGVIFLWQLVKCLTPVSKTTSETVYKDYSFIP